MSTIAEISEPANELERLIAELSGSGLLVFVFSDGLSTAHLSLQRIQFRTGDANQLGCFSAHARLPQSGAFRPKCRSMGPDDGSPKMLTSSSWLRWSVDGQGGCFQSWHVPLYRGMCAPSPKPRAPSIGACVPQAPIAIR